MFRSVQQVTLYYDTITFRNVGKKTLQALYVNIGLFLYQGGKMKEHGMYFGKNQFYQIIRDNGGIWNDSKERPIICLMKSLECDKLYWAIPVGNYDHRDENAKKRIQKYMDYNRKDIRSCFYHVGNTNEKSIFFISDVVPFTEKYIDREYKNKTKRIHVVKNKILLSELEYKLGRILEFENRYPNSFRQHITDIKNYLIEELKNDKNKDTK